MADSSIIVWDDQPSSPFLTDINDASRHPSHSMPQATDPEIDAIFDNPQTSPIAHKTPMPDLLDTDKENVQPSILSPMRETPLKRALGRKDPATAPRPTGRGQMLPPSTTKRPISPMFATTSKKGQQSYSQAEEEDTPSRPRFTRTGTDNSRSGTCDLPAIDETGVDDTCFSNFSAVPDMTLFAKLGQSSSPFKSHGQQSINGETPRPSRKRVSPSRSPSPTPRRQRAGTNSSQDATQSLLIDFTHQFDALGSQQRSPVRPMGLASSRTESNLASYMSAQRSPVRGGMPPKQSSLLNLLDFELPPPPTPRSAPSFSAREVESLKSSFQSQISGIKAKLSGKEAEVDSLKKALEDAERRASESDERERIEKLRREAAEQEKESWEKRGLEVERLLSSVKEEVVKSEMERESLVRRTEEAERKTEELEGRNLDLTTKLATVGHSDSADGSVDKDAVHRLVQAQLDAKIESVSRELHTVYKKKHETKVATLKKSYEARGEKKCAELQSRLDQLERQNEELKLGHRDAGQLDSNRGESERFRIEAEEQKAAVTGLQQELESIKQDHARLVSELEAEREEKGELVAAVDEMLALQASDSVTPAAVEDFRKSLSRPSGLRAPAPGFQQTTPRPSGLSKMSRLGSGR